MVIKILKAYMEEKLLRVCLNDKKKGEREQRGVFFKSSKQWEKDWKFQESLPSLVEITSGAKGAGQATLPRFIVQGHLECLRSSAAFLYYPT